MAMALEIRERQKNHLSDLLIIKKATVGQSIPALEDAILRAVIPMESEDVAWVEKLIGIKAI